jgi:sugar phosphate isomerase/epimerase
MQRRSFIKTTSLSTIALAMGSTGIAAMPSSKKIPALGIQLYMVEEDMEKDAASTLHKLGSMGYTQIESYDGSKGMFWGMTNKAFKTLAASAGLTMVSSHYNDDNTPFETKAAMAAEIGMKYLICPWKGPQKHIDDFKRIAEEFNANGTICKKHGIKFGYHSHDYPFKEIDGQIPEDVLLANTAPSLVDFQMDFYYVVTQHKDPFAYLQKYKGRYKLCHMRDVLKVPLPAGSEDESACDLGQGIIDYPKLIAASLASGVEYFFVEQSRFYKETPLQSAQVNADYLKKFM